MKKVTFILGYIWAAIKWFFRCFFSKPIETIKECEAKGLTIRRNIYGEEIMAAGWARSWWEDKYGFGYLCNELHSEGGNSMVENLFKSIEK